MAGLVGDLERELELAEAVAIQAERGGGSGEALPLLGRDDAVLDGIGEHLFVVGFEPAEADSAGELACFEGISVLERGGVVGHGRSLARLFGKHKRRDCQGQFWVGTSRTSSMF